MNATTDRPLALFVLPDGKIYPDSLISGTLFDDLEGKPCPHSDRGRLPEPLPLVGEASPSKNRADANYNLDKGNPGDLCPPCAKQQLTNLGHWQGRDRQTLPAALLPLRLFKCRKWLWLVIPGLYDAKPSEMSSGE
jgi:hypothetical protein